MHVAQFVHRYPPALGGAEAYAERLVEHLRANGDTVDVWTTTAIELEDFWRAANVSVRDRRAHLRSRLFLRRYPPMTFPLRRYLLKALTLVPSARFRSFLLPCNPICPAMWRDAGRYDGPLDAVHAMAFPYAFPILCARRLARRRGVPFLLTPFLHLGDDRTRRQYTQPALAWLLKDADKVFVQTNLERDAVLELGVKPERVMLQGLGVDASECTGGDRAAFRRKHGITADEVVIGHLANLSVEKGSVDLIQAAEQLDARIVLAGPSMANFRKFFASAPNSERFILTAQLTEPEKRDFFAGIDVFALPSRCDSFGLVLLEAWANGVPCVAYRAGGPGEIIQHERDGLLAACGNIGELTAHLQRLLLQPAIRTELGAAGRSRLPKEFDWNDKLELVRGALLPDEPRTKRAIPRPKNALFVRGS